MSNKGIASFGSGHGRSSSNSREVCPHSSKQAFASQPRLQVCRNFEGPEGKAGFSLLRSMCGHLGAVTGLALMNGVLWSGGSDGTIRLWNAGSGEEAHLIPAVKKVETFHLYCVSAKKKPLWSFYG